jgi:hypothetical protein
MLGLGALGARILARITFLASTFGLYYKNDLNINKSTKERIKKMSIFELSRKSLIVMLLSMMALVMLPGCSSTEEVPATDTGTAPPTESGGDDVGYNECVLACGDGDPSCIAACAAEIGN